MGAQTTSASQPYLSPLNINVLKASWDVTSHFQEGLHDYVVIRNRYCRCNDHGYGDHANNYMNSYNDNENGVFLIKWPTMCHVYNCSFEASWLHSSRQSSPMIPGHLQDRSQRRVQEQTKGAKADVEREWESERESDRAHFVPDPPPPRQSRPIISKLWV